MNEIKDLIQFLTVDIDLINKGIQKDYPLLLRNIQKDRQMLYITEDCFIDLINKYCFHPLPPDYNYVKGYIPNDRLELFKNIFLSEIKKSNTYSCTYVHGGTFIYSVEKLYVKFFQEVFSKSIITSQKVQDIASKLLNDWEFFLENQQIPVKIIFFLPDVFIEKEVVKLTKNFEIRSILSILQFEKQGYELTKSFEIFGPVGSFLIFNTNIKGNHNFIRDPNKIKNIEQIEMEKEWYEKLYAISEIFLCLNLAGISFANESKSLILPWWFGEQDLKFETKPISIGKNTITDDHLKKIIEIFEKASKLNITHDKELELALYKYSLLPKRDFFYDAILDEFIILESIFTKDGISEVSYRLSSNLAFFLADDIEQFKNIYNCIMDFYKIRSKIAHGEDWTTFLSKERIRKHLGIDDPNVEKSTIAKKIYYKLRGFIDKTLIKILGMKYAKVIKGESQKIMNKFKGTYFVENSFLRK